MNVVGIDVSTRAVDIVKLPLDHDHAIGWRYESHGHLAADRLVNLRGLIPGAASYFWDDVAIVAIERPVSRVNRTSVENMMAVVGMVVGSVPRALRPWFFMPAEWRKECGIPGNAKKPQVGEWAGKRWVDPPSVLSQDALDAFCVAWAARAVNQRAQAA